MGCGKFAIRLKLFFATVKKSLKLSQMIFKPLLIANDFEYICESADRKVEKEVAKKPTRRHQRRDHLALNSNYHQAVMNIVINIFIKRSWDG